MIIKISRQPETVSVRNRDEMGGMGCLFDRRGILVKGTVGILRESRKRVKEVSKIISINLLKESNSNSHPWENYSDQITIRNQY